MADGAFFSALFEEAPTYEELTFGTPKLEPCIVLNEHFRKAENQLVTLRGIEPRFTG